MTTDIVRSVLQRIDDALPDLDVSSSHEVLARRARAWLWPSVQMAVAAALAWWAARRLGIDAASYAPITSVGALGLGRERRLGRSGLMLAGLSLGVIAAEIAGPLIGRGWWQIGVLLGLTAIGAGALLDRELAVTYAVINVVVLVTIPGREGWVPDRLLSGLLGVAVALCVILLLLPPRPVSIVRRRLHRAARLSTEALDLTARLLDAATVDDATASDGDERPLIAAARRLDDEIERSHHSVDQAVELVRWSPLRRRDRAEVERLRRVAHDLRPALRTASTIARLADRARALEVRASSHVVAGVQAASVVVPALVTALVDHATPPNRDDELATQAVERLLSQTCEQAVMIALQEEVRGLLADVATIIDSSFDGPVGTARQRAAGATVDGITFGHHDAGG